jgi:hypothetical protein
MNPMLPVTGSFRLKRKRVRRRRPRVQATCPVCDRPLTAAECPVCQEELQGGAYYPGRSLW